MTLLFLHDIKKSKSSNAFLYLKSNVSKALTSFTKSWPYLFRNLPTNELWARNLILAKNRSATVVTRKAAGPSDILVAEYLMNNDLTLIDWKNILLYMTWNGISRIFGSKIWNSLPYHIKSSKNLESKTGTVLIASVWFI